MIAAPGREPNAWTETDVTDILTSMLRAINQAKHPDADPGGPVSLRGFSWIVNSFEGGVLIALEMSLGAVVAGPFDVAEDVLTGLLRRVLDPSLSASSLTVH